MKTIKRTTVRVMRWGFLLLMLAGGVWYARTHPRLLDALRGMSAYLLIMTLLLVTGGKMVQAMQFKALGELLDLEVSFGEWFGLTVCKSMYGLLVPGRPGSAMQAVYLKKKYGFTFARFGALFTATNLLNAVTYASVGILACGAEYCMGGNMSVSVALVGTFFLALSVGGGIVLVVATHAFEYLPWKKLKGLSTRARKGLTLFKNNPAVLAKVCGMIAIRNLSGGTALFVVGRTVGLELSFFHGMMLASFGSFGMFLPLTPGSIGINEGIMFGVAQMLGMAGEIAALAGLVKRSVGVLMIFTIGPIAQYILTADLMTPQDGEPSG